MQAYRPLRTLAGIGFLVAVVSGGLSGNADTGPASPSATGPSSLRKPCTQGDVLVLPGGRMSQCAMPDAWVAVGSFLPHDQDDEENQATPPDAPLADVAGNVLMTSTLQRAVGIVSVRQFGAAGDGVADDYSAIKAAAEYICTAPGARLVFPPGVYRIGHYRIVDGPNRNDVQNIRYNGCNGVQIIGKGAKIDVTGAFHRSADVSRGDYSLSYSVGVIPFEMLNSSNFTIVGFELDGNVDQMTRDPKVAEGGNAGILTTNCKNYTIENVNVHHFHTDGITLGANSTVADQGGVLRNITAANNARQGLSVIQLRTAIIANSQFLNTGRTGGSYGAHEPAAGVDVEPERVPPAEDVRTGLLTFENCRFEENLGAQFISALPERVEMISVRNSYFKATSPDGYPLAFLNAPATGEASGNTFDLGPRYSVALGPQKKESYPGVVKLTYSGNTFNLKSKAGISAPVSSAPVDFVGNIVRVESSPQETSSLGLYYLDRVEANTFFVAGSGYIGPTGSQTWVIALGRVRSVRNNVYSTDLTGSRQYKTVYYGSGMTVVGEKFQPAGNFVPLVVP